MSDTGTAALGQRTASAGALLRRAREAQNMPIEALAAATKVVPKKLEALEADRHDELSDATFVRALSQAVCRHLKVDPAPVLALLPPLTVPHRLERVAAGLNTPFHERPGRLVPREWARSAMPVLWLALVIALAALAIYLFPAHWRPWVDASTSRPPVDTVADAASGVAMVAVPIDGSASSSSALSTLDADVPGPVSAAEAPPIAASAAFVVAAATSASTPEATASGWLQVRTTAPSWVEVVDARGRSLISRVLQADESVTLDGTAPLKIKIGNARVTRLTLRGQPYELAAHTKDNVARLEVR